MPKDPLKLFLAHTFTKYVLIGKVSKLEFDQGTTFLQLDTVATIYFAACFVLLLFEGGGYFFGKLADMNDGWVSM